MNRRHVSLPTRHGAAALGLCTLLLSGCAGATRVALPDAWRNQLGSVKTVVGLEQQEINAAVIASTGGAGLGLLGAIIDSAVTNSRTKDAEAAVAPVRDALVGNEPGATLGAALTRELAAVPWLKPGAIEVRQVPNVDAANALATKAGESDLLLLVQTSYKLSPSFNAIVCTANVSLIPRGQPANGSGANKPIYFNRFSSTALLATWPAKGAKIEEEEEALSTASGGQLARQLEEAAALWAASGGRPARQAVDGGMNELAMMIAFDLPQAAPADGAAYHPVPGSARVELRDELTEQRLTGLRVKDAGARTWVRLRSGDLVAIAKETP